MSTGFDESVCAAWERFEDRLMAGLAQIGETALAISVVGEPAEDRCLPYVQLRGDGDLIQAEVSGSEFLDPAYGLDDNQVQTLMVLGWESPDGEDRPNWWYDVPYDEREVLRSMVTEAFRLVFSVVHPRFLESNKLNLGQDEVEHDDDEPANPVVEFPESGDELVDLVDQALVPMFGVTLERDEDGDFPFFVGLVPLWVRVPDGQPLVRIFSHAVCGVRNLEQAAIEIGILNRRTPLIKFYLSGDVIVAAVDLPAAPFVGAQLRHAIENFLEVLNDLARDLALRVDGHLILDEVTPPGMEEPA